MSSILAKGSQAAPSPKEEAPFYGWRYIQHVEPDGTVRLETMLLTLEDVLHPQEEDCIPENTVHLADRNYLYNVAKAREPNLDRGLVFSDCLIDWGVEGQRNTSPDISVFAGLKARPADPIGTFHLAESGGHCLGAIELVSPETRTNDVDAKLREYHRAKVPLYVIVDQKKEGGNREVNAYRYTARRYEAMRLDKDQCVALDFLGVRLGLKNNRVVCFDATTGAELGDYGQIEQRLREEARARQAAEEQAREQAQARQAAEEQAREQAQARQAAEEQAREQAEARQAAEEQAREQAEARQAAEERAREQAEARQAAEIRIQEMEAELRRLRGEN